MPCETRKRFLDWVAKARIEKGLREALVTACTAEPPIPSVNALARRQEVTPRWLDEQWRRSAGIRSPPLKTFLEALQVVRILELRAARLEWASICRQLNISESTLRRRIRFFADSSLSQICPEDAQAILFEVVQDLAARFAEIFE